MRLTGYRECWIAAGRRSGKSVTMAVVACQADHHKRCVCVGTRLPPPNRTSALLALPGPVIDTDHAVVTAAAAMMIPIVMLLRNVILHLWTDPNDRNCRWRGN